MPLLPNLKDCTGCLACVDICNKGALQASYNIEGHLSYVIDPELCVSCGLCEKVCPQLSAFGEGINDLSASHAYAAWAHNDTIRRAGTSGAVFGAIAKMIIDNNGIVIGASLDKFRTTAKVVDSVESILSLQGSKYMQSDYSGVYKKAASLLQKGRRVLFSGLPCQVAAMLSFLAVRKIPKDNLITIDLICGGVPSIFLVDAFRREYSDKCVAIHGFRNKTKYEFSYVSHDNEVITLPISERPLPLCGFYTELTSRYSCYNCKYAKGHRYSDITIGDFWGSKKDIEERRRGISVAIVHSDKGEEILNSSPLYLEPINWRDFLPHNPRVVFGLSPRAHSWQRKKVSYAFTKYSYEKLQELYANKVTPRKPWLYLGKGCRWIRSFFWHSHINRYVKKLLSSYEDSTNNISLFK